MQIKQTRQILLTNLSLVALVGWLLIFGILTLSTNALNEDSAALLYLFGLPLSAAAGCAAALWLCARRGLVFTAQQCTRSLLLAPIVYTLAEYGLILGVIAPQQVELATVTWNEILATCWLFAVVVACLLTLRSTPPTPRLV